MSNDNVSQVTIEQLVLQGTISKEEFIRFICLDRAVLPYRDRFALKEEEETKLRERVVEDAKAYENFMRGEEQKNA